MVLDDTYGADGSTLMKQHTPLLSPLAPAARGRAERKKLDQSGAKKTL